MADRTLQLYRKAERETEDAASQQIIAEERLLEKYGWHRTCSLPGSRWMWKKEMDEKTIYVEKNTALYITLNAIELGMWSVGV